MCASVCDITSAEESFRGDGDASEATVVVAQTLHFSGTVQSNLALYLFVRLRVYVCALGECVCSILFLLSLAYILSLADSKMSVSKR